MTLTEELKELARWLGFAAVGITGAEPFSQAEAAAAERTRAGLMDGLGWWSEARVQASADPRRATPEARSVVALAYPYPVPANAPIASQHPPSPMAGPRQDFASASGGGQGGGGPIGRIASYALGRDYHDVLLERMQPLVNLLRDRGYRAKTYVDHGWMLDRAAAARAGIGWLGKNTNLLVPGVGSSVLLCEIVTSAELDRTQQLRKNCGGCDVCMRACPTGALVAPGVLDNRKCISYWTIEHHGVIPTPVRPLIGDWIFGCDLCQEVCPVNAAARPASPDSAALRAFGPLLDSRPQLEELLTLDDEAFRRRFRDSAVWRTRRAGLLRNVCVALGNVADRSSVPCLRHALLSDPAALVRGHAAWALGRLGGSQARAALETALNGEADAWVREECARALEDCGPLAVPSGV
jgi:epoxyqueuosine reductase